MNSLPRFRLGGALLALALISAGARADVVLDWNETLTRLSAQAPATLMPHLEARVYATMHAAMHDAMMSAAPHAEAIGAVSTAATAAAGTAAHDVLAHMLPRRVAIFDALLRAELASLPEGEEKARGLLAGRAAAAAVLQKRESDGWIQLAQVEPPTVRPARDRELAEALRNGPPPSPWAQATPFVLRDVAQVEVEPPRSVDMDGGLVEHYWLTRARIFDAVNRSDAVAIGEFWSERPIATWNRIARAMLRAAQLDSQSEARALAALNLALADATLGAMHWRFAFDSWHPCPIDRRVATESTFLSATSVFEDTVAGETVAAEPMQAWLPPIAEYPALAAAVAGAAEATLGRLTRAEQLSFAVPAHGNASATRTFAGITSAAREAAFAASLDGRHSREACVAGYQYGVEIGRLVAKRVNRRS